MSDKTKIEWCDYTFNPWWGCTKVAAACDNCYAERQANRFGKWFDDNPRRMFGDKHWAEPLKWNRKAASAGVRASVFCGSMCDVFEDRPELIEPRARVWKLIQDTPYLDWLLLTKRAGLMHEHLKDMQIHLTDHSNVWIGVTIENNAELAYRIREMFDQRTFLRKSLSTNSNRLLPQVFLSIEPLLGPIALARHILTHIDGVIVGGESGFWARPMHPDWARSIRDQCEAAGVKFFFKQWGEWVPTFPYDSEGDIVMRSDGVITGRKTEFSPIGRDNVPNPFGYIGDGIMCEGTTIRKCERDERLGREFTLGRVGKKNAGRLLDGRTHDELPWRTG